MIEEMSKGEERYKLEKMENLIGDVGYDNGINGKIRLLRKSLPIF